MEIFGKIKVLDRVPYEAGIKLENANVPSVSLLCLMVNDEAVIDTLATSESVCHFSCHIGLAKNIKIEDNICQQQLIQPSKGIHLIQGCGVVIHIVNEYDFEVAIEDLTTKLLISCERESMVSVGQTVRFEGELRAKLLADI